MQYLKEVEGCDDCRTGNINAETVKYIEINEKVGTGHGVEGVTHVEMKKERSVGLSGILVIQVNRRVIVSKANKSPNKQCS